MRASPTCPRCRARVRPPNAWSSAWTCEAHGDVHPLQPAKQPSNEALAAIRRTAQVPVWVPWPLPTGWLVTGFAEAGDDRTGARASLVALSGPALTAGPADMFLVAEEPGVGLGGRVAGLNGTDPGAGFDASPPHAKVEVRSHPMALWSVDVGPDRAAFVGEAMGNWLWIVLWPADAGMLMLEQLMLHDLRDSDMEPDLPFGAFCPRLDLPPAD